MELAVRPDWRSDAPIVTVLMAAFGAQAMIAGLFAATAIFTRRTFALYGAALLPFFVFDYYFYAVEPMLTEIGLLDAVGNAVMLVLCWLGWKTAPISLKEYERLLRRDHQVLLVKDLDDETLEAIRTAEPSERSKALNHLVDDTGTG
ncbi:MAG TPA: hypothetical protein VIT45_10160 [Allosphingosinicella sp.]